MTDQNALDVGDGIELTSRNPREWDAKTPRADCIERTVREYAGAQRGRSHRHLWTGYPPKYHLTRWMDRSISINSCEDDNLKDDHEGEKEDWKNNLQVSPCFPASTLRVRCLQQSCIIQIRIHPR